MLKFENILTVPESFEAAIRGMRNPMNSWAKSDSYPAVECGKCGVIESDVYCNPKEHDCSKFETFFIGPKDKELMQSLIKGGTEHCKFRRMITIWVDITAPLYWWKEFETYHVGPVSNSCSTMHKIAAKEFTLDDFSHEHLIGFWKTSLKETIEMLNKTREMFLESQDKELWYRMIQLLPSSYNQKRTIMMNYEVLAKIYKERKNHKLDEWRVNFMNFIESLPESWIITYNGKEEKVVSRYLFYIPYKSADEIPLDISIFQQLHRDYWWFIANNKLQYKPDIVSSITHGIIDITNRCFACEYAYRLCMQLDLENTDDCYGCPIKCWNAAELDATYACERSTEDALYQKWINTKDPKIALEIANLEWFKPLTNP